MNEILTEINEILKRSPSRFLKAYFCADISVISDSEIKVEIISTLDFFGDRVVPVFPGYFENHERDMEKWHATGIAIGALEYYLTDKKLNYSKEIVVNDKNEINARIIINV
jgi:hypothetical protein